MNFQEGLLVLGGNFNVPLNPLQDTSTGKFHLTYWALKQIKCCLQDLSLHDAWRILHPTVKDFTFFSAPHNKYSRIDYLFLSQQDLLTLTETTIDPMTHSNHHPISMTLTFLDKLNRTYIWKLDPTLLTDNNKVQKISSCLRDYFTENDTPDTSTQTQWEAHKCVIRRKLISLAASVRKEKKAKLANLFAKLKKLEALHKHTLAQQTHSELTETRTLIKELHHNLKKKFILSQKLFYEFGNKSGRLLAQVLHKKKANNTIHQLHSTNGKTLTHNDDIAKEFENYYSSLYDLQTSDPPLSQTSLRSRKIDSLLNQFGPKKIPHDTAVTLDSLITITEWEQAIKQLKPGKSPGPDGLSAIYYRMVTSN